jgi:hypothetical protein
VIKPLVQAP